MSAAKPDTRVMAMNSSVMGVVTFFQPPRGEVRFCVRRGHRWRQTRTPRTPPRNPHAHLASGVPDASSSARNSLPDRESHDAHTTYPPVVVHLQVQFRQAGSSFFQSSGTHSAEATGWQWRPRIRRSR